MTVTPGEPARSPLPRPPRSRSSRSRRCGRSSSSASGSPRGSGARSAGDPGRPAAVAEYADGVGPEKSYVIPRAPDGTLGAPTSFVADAHAAGLLVHPYTFRRENSFLPADPRSSADPAGIGGVATEIERFLAAGIDGFFTDDPDVGAAAAG